MFKFMRFAYNLLLGLLAFSFLLAACGPALAPSPTAEPARTPTPTVEPTDDSPPVSHGNEIGGYVELVDALRAGGATVVPSGSVEQPFFDVPGLALRVNGADIQVFEYADEAAREAESSLITPDGQPDPTSIIDWVAPPNFWAKGRVITLYVGTDADVIARLTEVLGDPITESAAGAQTYPEAALAAISALAQLKGISAGEITVVSVEAVQWSDSCLGVSTPGIVCLQVITPGYRIVLSAGGAQYEFHTNETGSAVRLVPQP